MELNVKLQVFEGPLDLLLHLLDKNKVDIYDIPIAEITNQYMEYMDAMKEQNLDITSEFLVMAATLLSIKSKMLLPKTVSEDGEEEEDPRSELVRQLLEYKMYRYMSEELRRASENAGDVLFHDPSIPKEVMAYAPPVDLDELVGDLTMERLHEIFQQVIKRRDQRMDPIRSKFGNIKKEPVSVDEKISSLKDYAKTHRSFSFRNILETSADKTEVIVTFLAILEMMKDGSIHITQEETFGDIQIESLLAEEEGGEQNV